MIAEILKKYEFDITDDGPMEFIGCLAGLPYCALVAAGCNFFASIVFTLVVHFGIIFSVSKMLKKNGKHLVFITGSFIVLFSMGTLLNIGLGIARFYNSAIEQNLTVVNGILLWESIIATCIIGLIHFYIYISTRINKLLNETIIKNTENSILIKSENIKNKLVNKKFKGIFDLAKNILENIDENNIKIANRFLNYYLPLVEKLEQKYIKYIDVPTPGAQETLIKIEQTLPIIQKTFEHVLQHIQEPDYMDIEAELKVLEQISFAEGGR